MSSGSLNSMIVGSKKGGDGEDTASVPITQKLMDKKNLMIIAVVVIVLVLVWHFYYKKPAKKERKENYRKNDHGERTDPQSDWNMEEKVQRLMANQERNFSAMR